MTRPNDDFRKDPRAWLKNNYITVAKRLESAQRFSRKPLSFTPGTPATVSGRNVWQIDWAGESTSEYGEPLNAAYVPAANGSTAKASHEVGQHDFIFTETLTGCAFGVSKDGTTSFHARGDGGFPVLESEVMKLKNQLQILCSIDVLILFPRYGSFRLNNEYDLREHYSELVQKNYPDIKTVACAFREKGQPVIAYYSGGMSSELTPRLHGVVREFAFITTR